MKANRQNDGLQKTLPCVLTSSAVKEPREPDFLSIFFLKDRCITFMFPSLSMCP